MIRRLIVTHHAPDLDAIAATWLLKRFDAQHYATAKVVFVNPGDSFPAEEAEAMGIQSDLITYVDTGLGQFDHHQADRGQQFISATSLVYDHLCQLHPELKDDLALQDIAQHCTEIDHFGEIYWPEADHVRYEFMLHELIRGLEFQDPHNDDQQLQFGFTCLDSVYASITLRHKAQEILAQDGKSFELPDAQALAIESSNGDTEKLAQKKGYDLVVRKDPKLGSIRIKLRPDTQFDLKPVAELIHEHDTVGTWYYHPSGKMLLNGSSKHRDQKPSPLT
ncbi:MAG TPA: hypothetical protein VF209_04000, partial [Patescibacteria group bacterium]